MATYSKQKTRAFLGVILAGIVVVATITGLYYVNTTNVTMKISTDPKLNILLGTQDSAQYSKDINYVELFFKYGETLTAHDIGVETNIRVPNMVFKLYGVYIDLFLKAYAIEYNLNLNLLHNNIRCIANSTSGYINLTSNIEIVISKYSLTFAYTIAPLGSTHTKLLYVTSALIVLNIMQDNVMVPYEFTWHLVK